jgi:hypothetical protein
MIWKLSLFIYLISVTLCAQADSAFIRIESEIWSEAPTPFQIKINGAVLHSPDSLIKVSINDSSFDTIIFHIYDFKRVSAMKLRAGARPRQNSLVVW